MIKTLSAVAISAFIAAALFVLSGYAPEVGPGQLAALQKSSRRDMKHNDQIILPYAVSDTFSNFAIQDHNGTFVRLPLLRGDSTYAPLPFAQSGAGVPVEIALPRLEPLTLDAIVP